MHTTFPEEDQKQPDIAFVEPDRTNVHVNNMAELMRQARYRKTYLSRSASTGLGAPLDREILARNDDQQELGRTHTGKRQEPDIVPFPGASMETNNTLPAGSTAIPNGPAVATLTRQNTLSPRRLLDATATAGRRMLERIVRA